MGPKAIAAVTVIAASFECSPGLVVAETYVLPVVARGVHGLNGSVWDSEVRISGPNGYPPGRIRRLWVALPEGGIVDDPATAPQWVFPTFILPAGMPIPPGMVVLTGDQLLQGTDAPKGAVALDVDGTGNHVFLHNSNTLGQPRLPQDAEGPPCCLPGNGQLIGALTGPLVGQGFIPWITSGRWPYRVSVGLINPTAQARNISIDLDLLGPWPRSASTTQPDGTYWLLSSGATLAIDLPPWGFRQIDDLASVMLQQCPSCDWLDPVAPAAVYLFDYDTRLPFYAYASVIWTPLNDPEFITAVPSTR